MHASLIEPQGLRPGLAGLPARSGDSLQPRATPGHGERDRIVLSPLARDAAAVATTESRSTVAAQGSFDAVQGAIGEALDGMRRDLGRLFQALGLGDGLGAGFTDPIKAALEQGLDFTAEVSYVAATRTTTRSGGEVSQSVSLIAKSIQIEVNHDSGEISLNVESVALTQAARGPALPGGTAPSDAAGLPLDLERLLAEPDAAPLPNTDANSDQRGEAGRAAFRTRFVVHSVEHYRNAEQQRITRLTVDALAAFEVAARDAPALERLAGLAPADTLDA